MARRSSIELLPPAILAVVHQAIREGATIDEIVQRIRAHGGSCSRSAVVRYAKRARERLQRWREDRGLADFWLDSLGERPEGSTGPLALETLRSLAMRVADALVDKEEPPAVDQIATLALAMQRIEGAGKNGADRESVIARNPHPQGFGHFAAPKRDKGLSPEAVAHIRAAVEGHWGSETSAEEGEAAVQAYWKERMHDAHEESAQQYDRHTPARRRLGPP